MSIETWKEEFYPVTAEAVNAGGSASVGELIEHSLRKWRGATEENLKRHGIRRNSWRDTELEEDSRVGAWINFGTDTCALCHRYFKKNCQGCPVAVCFRPERGYHIFSVGGPPDLMIHELEEALEKWREENV